ncbi:hypothetical protein BH10BAC2_BH10BAC2_08590 [soil metagenome]
METYHIPHNIKVFGNQVTSFPEGIGAAFNALIKILPQGDQRPYYGISECTKDGTMYIAAAEKKNEAEATQYGCSTYTVEKGDYLSVTVNDWMSKTGSIKNVFEEIMKDGRADNTKPAIEIYKDDKEMLCMVKLRQSIESLPEFKNTTEQFLLLIESFTEKQLNQVPFKDSWTAAQVVAHVTKSGNSIAQAMKLEGAIIERDADERVDELKKTFLDYSAKFTSPEFILPRKGFYERQQLIDDFNRSIERLKEASAAANLTEAIKHVAFGEITKLELLNFVLMHMQRHTRQLKNISAIIKQQ